jgi:hypothetical protein
MLFPASRLSLKPRAQKRCAILAELPAALSCTNQRPGFVHIENSGLNAMPGMAYLLSVAYFGWWSVGLFGF